MALRTIWGGTFKGKAMRCLTFNARILYTRRVVVLHVCWKVPEMLVMLLLLTVSAAYACARVNAEEALCTSWLAIAL